MPLLPSAITWLRLTFRWSSSTQTWQERIGDVALASGILLAGAISLLVNMGWWQLLLVWCVCLLPALALSRAGWLKVFGPVLYYDMVRQARRSRFTVLRFLYTLLLVFLLFSVAGDVTNWGRGRFNQDGYRQAAEIAQRYFEVFMVAQFLTVVLLTPSYVAGAIAEEKDRKTLEFMLATDLLNREIVLSKLGSRFANLALVVLTGLPILSILQFLGGVDPNLVMAGFVVTAMTIAGQAGVSILCSVTCKKPRDAISLAYLAVIAFYAVALLSMALPLWVGRGGGVLDAMLQLVVDTINKGNLISLIGAVKDAGYSGTLATKLPLLVRDYSLFHGCVALLCTGLAVARIRRVALVQTYGTAIKTRKALRFWKRPPIGSLPMMWKEIHCEGRGRATWISLIVVAVLVLATFAPAVLIVWDHWEQAFRQPVGGRWNSLGQSMNVWVRTCNVIVGCLTLLAVAVRASTSITSERDKQTFDTLLTTPLDSHSILFAKWTGSLLSVRYGILWLVLVWAVGVATGGLHIVSLGLVIIAWLVYAAFASALGLWFSTVCRTSLKATAFTIAAMIVLNVGHWLPWMCCGIFMAGGGGSGTEYLLKFHAGVLTPPFVMGLLPFSNDQRFSFSMRQDKEMAELLGFSIVGMLVWAVAAFAVYAVTHGRFRQITHRVNLFPLSLAEWRNEERRSRERRKVVPMSPWAPPVAPVPRKETEVFDSELFEPEEDSDDRRPLP